MDTERLINALVDDLEPVRRLRRPPVRAMLWTCGGLVYLLLLALVMSPDRGLVARLHDPEFLIEQALALLAAGAAAISAFALAVPGERRAFVWWLPPAVAAAWIGAVAMSALREAQVRGLPDAALQPSWACIGAVLTGTAIPAVLMMLMLRRGAVLTPRITAAYGGLAAAMLGHLGICLFHLDSSSVIVLVWHCGAVLAVSALAGLAAAPLLRNLSRGRFEYLLRGGTR